MKRKSSNQSVLSFDYEDVVSASRMAQWRCSARHFRKRLLNWA